MMIYLVAMLLLMGYMIWHTWVLMPFDVWVRVVIVVGMIICLGMSVTMVTRWLDRLPMGISRAVYNIGSTAMIVSAYLVIIYIAVDLLRLVHVLPREYVRENGTTTVVIMVAIVGILVYGNINYMKKRRVEMKIEGCVGTEKPIRLVCASDLHVGYHNRRAELERWVDIINSEKPDIVLFGGDIIDRSLRPIIDEDMASALRRIEAPKYACLGNHEYYASRYCTEEEVRRFYEEAGICLLQDSVAREQGVTIIGRDDKSNQKRLTIEEIKEKYGVDATARGEYTILIDHQPYGLEEAEKAGMKFQFSGHTHRGQFWPVSWITDAVYECSWGKHKRGGTDYYISSGLGIWGPKYRIGTQSEYLVVDID